MRKQPVSFNTRGPEVTVEMTGELGAALVSEVPERIVDNFDHEKI